MADTFNYRIDHHGSLVRPAGLARDDADAVDAAVQDVVAYQRKLRSTVVTDGGYPYEDFRSPVLDGLSGVRRTGETDGLGLACWVAEALPKADGPLVADRVKRLGELTATAPKVTLPAPSYLAATLYDAELAASGGLPPPANWARGSPGSSGRRSRAWSTRASV